MFSLISCATTKKDQKTSAQRKADIYYNQGTQELITKDYTSAITHLMKANRLNPNNSEILNNLGMAYYFKGRKESAIKFIKKSLTIDSKNTRARLNIATIYVESNKFIEAKVQYDIILDDLTYQGQFKTYYNLGILYLKLNKQEQALNFFKQSLNENNQYCPTHFQLGKYYFENKNFGESLKSYELASLGTCYSDPSAHYHQALTHIKLKQYDAALSKLEMVVENFSLTKYERLANQKIKNINTFLTKSEKQSDMIKKSNGQIFTPDF